MAAQKSPAEDSQLDPLEAYLSQKSSAALLRILISTAFALSILSLILTIIASPNDTGAWVRAWLQNLSTEFFGAVVTYIIFDRLMIRQGSPSPKTVAKKSKTND